MKSTIIYILSLPILILFSCEETILIETDQADPQIIVEGLITNEMKRHTIKITQTADFYQAGDTPRISDASVTVSDNEGNTFIFLEEEKGIYRPQVAFEAKIGNTYDLTIDINGKLLTASEDLLPVTTIDSLTFGLNEEDTEEEEVDIFSVYMYTIEPQDEDNYYLFKFYRNSYWLNEEGEDITVTDDTAVGEAIDGIEAPYWYFKGDTARVEMYSLTRESFVFWNDVATLVFSDGGVFAPLPANPRSNITGGALGVFQVSAISAKEIIIE